jgi:hypothetical protein
MLHSSLGYITPFDCIDRRQEATWAERDQKLEQARERRTPTRQPAKSG